MKEESERKFPVNKVISACLAFWALTFVLFLVPDWDMADRGQFGDMFGAANAFFSALAFICLLIALNMQRTELGLQRNELALTRKEMELSRKEMEGQKQQLQRQNEVMALQAFETHFFHMLDLHKKNVSQITRQVNPEKVTTGKLAIIHIWNKGRVGGKSKNEEEWMAYYKWLYPRDIEPQMGDYFRTLYHIFSFIDASSLDATAKKRFANIIRAQLNNAELGLLFLNCLSSYGEGFKPLIQRYGMFKHLDFSSLGNGLVSLKGKYADSAFV